MSMGSILWTRLGIVYGERVVMMKNARTLFRPNGVEVSGREATGEGAV
jgi:hypothetical protein